jgi:carbamoyl-phosphate synthase small subunit
MDQPAILLLEDGTVFTGKTAGKPGTTTGEICFTTGMTGYQEVFTDPSFYGQILVTTNVHIGNYGTMKDENESGHVQISGLVCKDFTDHFSRIKADDSIQDYFLNEERTCIYGVDTRAIVRHIRDKGAMNAIISSEILDISTLKKKLEEVPSMAGLELASKVTTSEPYEKTPDNPDFKVAALDFGIKQNIVDCFVERNCHVKVFPADTSSEDILAFNPDGIFLSNGPGDPSAMTYAIKTIKQLIETNIPMFGICLGHQLLALSVDVPTYKMHHGHRGINHPVKNIVSGGCEITTQNHGFGVSPEHLKKRTADIEITHVNLNDETIEGIRLKSRPAFSVQFHPEASPGPHDSRYLFDDFIELMKKN